MLQQESLELLVVPAQLLGLVVTERQAEKRKLAGSPELVVPARLVK